MTGQDEVGRVAFDPTAGRYPGPALRVKVAENRFMLDPGSLFPGPALPVVPQRIRPDWPRALPTVTAVCPILS